MPTIPNYAILVILGCIITITSVHSMAFAESETFTVAARDNEQRVILLNEGNEIRYSVLVSGGVNDDIGLTIHYPDGTNDGGGKIYGKFEDGFTAKTSGRYVFEFVSHSILTNKSVVFSYEITKNTYYVYVDPLPDWASYASGIMYESTTYWQQENPKLHFFKVENPSQADFRVQWVKEFGVEHVGYAYGDKFIEVGLGDSQCLGSWHEYSPKHVASIMKHEIGHILGFGHSDDPKNIMYPVVQDKEYGIVESNTALKENQFGFIPACNFQTTSSINYSIKTTDGSMFDLYFVPSSDVVSSFSKNHSFEYYKNSECFGTGSWHYEGMCPSIRKNAGLLVISKSQNTIDVNASLQTVQLYSESESPLAVFLPEASSIETQGPDVSSKEPKCGEGTMLQNDQCVAIKLSKEKGGGCLIATAAYGTELAPQVQQLREIRDNHLLNTVSGTAFMSGFNQLYYSFSPAVADWERENPVFKEFVKISLMPMISSFSILNYVDLGSDASVVGYGIGIIILNAAMYVGIPIGVFLACRKIH